MMWKVFISNIKHMMGALFFIVASTLCVTAPIIGSSLFIAKYNNEFSKTDLITIVLSAVSVILTAVTIALAILGLFGYKVMLSKAEEEAKRVAKEEAKRVAKENSERIAQEISEKIAPRIIAEYVDTMKNDNSSYKQFFEDPLGRGDI